MAIIAAAPIGLHPQLPPPIKKCKQKETNATSAPTSLDICRNIRELEQIHAQKVKEGFTSGAAIKVLVACARLATLEALNHGRKVFDLFQEEEEEEAKNTRLFMWNSMIRCYASADVGEEAILLYLKMLDEGIHPDRFTFPFLVSGCAKLAAASEGSQIHASVVKMGLMGDAFILNSLIHFYAECREMDLARKLFDEMPHRNVVSWTSLICGYARMDCPHEAVSLFWEMVRLEEIQPNSVTISSVISACAKLQDLELGEKVYAYVCRNQVELNPVLVNTLVDMYMKCKAPVRARKLFNESERSLVLCNTMVSNYVRQGFLKEALNVVEEMLKTGLHPDRVTILAVINAFAQVGDLRSGRQCHGYIFRNMLGGWDVVNNAIIDMYMKCRKPDVAGRVFGLMTNKTVVTWNTILAGFVRNGHLDCAWRLFDTMPEKNLVSWNTMLGALEQYGCFEEVIALFWEMQISGVDADRVTMMSVASACGYLGLLGLAKWTHAYIERIIISRDILLDTALVDMYARCGDSASAMHVFDKMLEKDVSAWTTAIRAMAMEGNGRRAIELFTEMIECGLKPDGMSFVAVITACSHSGLVKEGQELFQSMLSEHNVSPHIVHYGCMVDLLGRAGLLQEALLLIESMPMEPNDIIWGSFLAACRIHKNVEMADYAAKRAVESAPDRTGIHVLASNVYASTGRWAEVAKVRLQLKEKGSRKIPGSSLIEVNGVLHEFTSGFQSHPQISQIVGMLDEIGKKLKHAGYMPDLANVLMDVEAEEKEHLLSRHSEKLAIALGLISTSHGATIRVVKNLRICSDCHTFAKFVSEMYSREIIIRDNCRYHFFRRGLCSCLDYW